MNILLIVTFIIWIYVLTVLKRGKLEFWYFIAGSVGLFIYMLILVEPVILAPLQKAVSAVAGDVWGYDWNIRVLFQQKCKYLYPQGIQTFQCI